MTMKKSLAVLAAASLILSAGLLPGEAEAKSHNGKGHQVKKKGLENALEHVKNERAREAIKRAMERKAAKQDDEDDDDDQQITAAQRVAKDKAALAIDFGGTDNAGSVTVPFDALPSKGAEGSTITWQSSNTAVISHDGKTVNRPAIGSGDIKVTMTATLRYESAQAVKTFEVTVKSLMTAAEKLAADKAALAVGFSTGDTSDSVTKPLTLPAAGRYGSTVSWISGNPAVISVDGKTVNRPAAGAGDTTVVLTAVISNGSLSEVKTFTLTVKQQLTDVQKVAADKASLAIGFQTGDNTNSVTRAVTLPAQGTNGSSVSWLSSNPTVISNDGKTVNRPANGTGDAQVVFTAVISSNGVSDIKTFTLIVKQQLTDPQKVAADKAALAIGFTGTDTASSVTGPLTLPTTGLNGSTVIWVSSNEAVISDDGKTVVRPTGTADVQVTLTAILMSGGSADSKAFTVTVKHR